MTKKAFIHLVHKYLDGTVTAEEQAAVEQYYQLFADAPEILDKLDEQHLKVLEQRMRQRIAVPVAAEDNVRAMPWHRRWYTRVAVAALLLCSLSVGWWILRDRWATESTLTVSSTPGVEENRFVLLPDGSKALLQPGSDIQYHMDGHVRTVTLTGQAWFDVAQMAGKPFVIHTGQVKTTVLGTAFSIRAWPTEADITVTVTRGKVQVEEEGKTLAVLEAEQQLVYHTDSKAGDESTVDSRESLAWVAQDMTFDGLPLGELVRRLERRYDVSIRLGNRALERCAITGRFSGTETLEEVLRILAATSGTQYRLDGSKVVIDGEGCE